MITDGRLLMIVMHGKVSGFLGSKSRGVCLQIAFCLMATGALGQTVQWWVSSADLNAKLTPQTDLAFTEKNTGGERAIQIDERTSYQSILGLGNSLEHSTCYNLSLLPAERREKAVESLVHPEKGIGMSLMRICIGTPDFTASPWYTYDDMPPGEKDPELKHFSIAKDREYVLPVLKLAKKVNPQLKFFASPWSPPAWMKTNDRIGGGSINPEHFGPLAEYFARFVKAYQAEGIEIHAVTIQNEPEYAPGTYPTCRWTADQQQDFIRDHLGPVFRARGLRTRIWCYDHNFNHPQFPTTILKDPVATAFVDGTAFHHYEGKPSAMTQLHEQFPVKHIYFTEGSTFGVRGAVEIMTLLRNWARSYNAWVTMINDIGKPNPGPHRCSPTCVVLNHETLELDYRFDYYMYGQFTKFIQPGAVRVASSESSQLPPNIAFRNPDGSMILIAANPETGACELKAHWNNKAFVASLPPRAVGSFLWKP
jgi:O-glycosyl hydrolase